MQLRSFRKPTGCRGIRTLSVFVTTIVAAIAIGGVIPASAAPHTVYTTEGYQGGSARFGEIGDHLYLCDHRSDHHGVGVDVGYYNDSGKWVDDWYWIGGGSGDCRDINLEVKEDTWVFYTVCLADHTKKGGKKPQIIGNTCSTDYSVFNDNVW